MSDTLDPYSEVVDVTRRWTRDWYSWILTLAEFRVRASATVAFSGGTPSYVGQRGFVGNPTDGGVGITTLTLSTPMTNLNYTVVVSRRGTSAGSAQANISSNNQFTVYTFDNGGVAQDTDFSVMVMP